jgi:hypothetical protein
MPVTVTIEKRRLFDFFKAEGIVENCTEPVVEIFEENNSTKKRVLKKVTISGLNLQNYSYYLLYPENPTSIKPSNPTERVIIEDRPGSTILAFIEMKPPKARKVEKKLERTFTWTYLLFNLLAGKEGRNLKVFLILCKYSDKELSPTLCKGEIEVFHNLRVKYYKKTYYSNGQEELTLNWDEVVNWPKGKPEICR